jgi:hypothetical protein
MFLAALAGSLLLAFSPTGMADSFTPLNGAQPRPFYAVGHNPNTLEEVAAALEHGANALEPDLMVLPAGSHLAQAPFTPNPTGIVMYHDPYVATTRVPLTLDEYLKGVHELALVHTNLSLIVFDTKSSAATAANGRAVLDSIRANLNTGPVHINVILSVAERADAAFFDNILGDLGPTEGVQIDQEDDPADINHWWFNTEHYFGNIGYGDGTVGVGPNLPRAIDHAAFLRATTGFPKAVTYVYVLNAESSEDSFIYAGVDGIIPDTFFLDPAGPDLDPAFIDGLINVVSQHHPEVRLATPADNPFLPANEAYGLEITTSNVDDAGTDADLTFTLHGCRGDATITVDTGEIHLGFESGRMEKHQTDWVTIPSKDLGTLTSITVHNDGVLQDGWHLHDIRVSSIRYIGANTNHNLEYIGNFNNWIYPGDTKPIILTPTFQAPLPTIQCPTSMIVPNDLDQCGAIVSFAPEVNGPCDDVTAVCVPASGSLFPIGTTPVSCYATNTSGGGSAPCTFTVTVQDTQVPVIICPAPMVVNATSPAGAVVPFAVQATDNCGVTVVSTPASGSIFAIGDTTVQSTATDASANQASCSFNVHVKGAAEQTADLLTAVNSLNISKPGVKNALLFQLNATLASLQSNNLVAACGSLQSFIGLVDAQRNKTISSSDADYLIAAASQIRAVIGCTP